MSHSINSFLSFSNKQKITSVHSLIYHAKFIKAMKFHKNLLQTRKNMGTQTYKEKFPRGCFSPAGIHSFLKKLASLWSHIFVSLQQILMNS